MDFIFYIILVNEIAVFAVINIFINRIRAISKNQGELLEKVSKLDQETINIYKTILTDFKTFNIELAEQNQELRKKINEKEHKSNKENGWRR